MVGEGCRDFTEGSRISGEGKGGRGRGKEWKSGEKGKEQVT